jgi:transcriptional regulator with XRE-family HTH domain
MTDVWDMHLERLKDPAYKAEYEALEDEFEIARQIISARVQSGLTQAELASRMGTSQSAIARLEGGKTIPSMRTLTRVAKATNCKIKIGFQSAEALTPANQS